MDVPFLYDNRYGIWHTNGGLPVTNVSVYQNYVHQNGRVGIMWQADDGLGTCLEEACRTAAWSPSIARMIRLCSLEPLLLP